MAVKYFKDPFAIAGDKTTIPNDSQPSGTVSYEAGWTLNYSLNPLVNPAAIQVPRTPMNQLFFDITNATQQYQQNSTADFITTLDNDGVAFPYTFNAIVRYDDGVNGVRLYRSLTTNNTSLPSVLSAWQILNMEISGTATGTANAITLNTSVAYQNLMNGDVVKFTAIADNTGACTFKLGTGATIAIEKFSSLGNVALDLNDIMAGGNYVLVFNGSVFILTNPSIDLANVAYTNVTNNFTLYQNIPIVYASVAFNPATVQNISSSSASSPTKILFPAIPNGQIVWWDDVNNRFRPNIQGWFRIEASLSFITTSSSMFANLFKNGAPMIGLGGGNSSNNLLKACVEIFLNGTTDYVEIFFYSNAASAIVGNDAVFIGNASMNNYFRITYVGT